MSLFRDLDDYKLETEFDRSRNQVIHRSYKADWAYGRGRIAVEEKWTSECVVGSGSFGVVRHETRQDAYSAEAQSRSRAVKELRKIDMERRKVDFRKELMALTKFSRRKFVQSQAFVQFFGWYDDDEHIYLAMEYFEHGTLDNFINGELTERDAQVIAHQLLLGLEIMHEEHFAHRDMKPQNVFVVQHSPNWWVKIGDFGISKRAATDTTVLHTAVGTPLYLAPEVFHYVPAASEESDAYTNAVDVWSFACVVYEMLTLRPPFPVWPQQLVSYCHGGGLPYAPPSRASRLAFDFVKSTLVAHPEQRPTAKEALALPWIRADAVPQPTIPDAGSTRDGAFPAKSPTAPSIAVSLVADAPQSHLDTVQFMGRPASSPNDSAWVPSSQENSDVSTASSKVKNIWTQGPDYGTMTSSELSETMQSISLTKDKCLCSICGRAIAGDYYRCSSCKGGLDFCSSCISIGHHCPSQEHWLVKRDSMSPTTTMIPTQWMLYKKAKPPSPPPIHISSRRLIKTFNRFKRQGPCDYCHICGTSFPVDSPPPRHEWELHGTSDRIPEQRDSYAKLEEAGAWTLTSTWIKRPTPEEEALHKEKLERLESELQTVFKQKVQEKETKLLQSENELYARHREMKEALQRQGKTLQETWQERKSKELQGPSKEPQGKTKRQTRWFFGRS